MKAGGYSAENWYLSAQKKAKRYGEKHGDGAKTA